MRNATTDTSCPRCGSDDTRRRPGLFSLDRVCRVCRKRFSPRVGGSLLALVFAAPGLLFTIVAVAIGHIIIASNPQHAGNTRDGLLCSGIFAIPAIVCFALAIRELRRPRTASPTAPYRDELLEELDHDLPVEVPRLLPRETAEAIVRAVAEKHGAKGIARKLGNFRASLLANAVNHFADQMGDDETPLAFVDRSFLGNGKAGFLVTNRGLYSSFYAHVLWLKDIHVVSYSTPTLADSFSMYTLSGRVRMLTDGMGHLQARLFVNGKVVYSSPKPLTPAFWIEVLTTLGEASRERPLPVLELEADAGSTDFFRPDAAPRPRSVILATVHSPGEGRPPDVRRFSDPTPEQIDQAIRDLDARDRPSLRLSAGEAPVLEIRGGDGKYALRQPGDGWVYYDPSGGEEEVEVCEGERCPAFYVCTDLQTVLRIARRFAETGAFE